MGDVKRYKVTVNGTETVLKLSDEDAKRYEDAELLDTPASAAKAKTPANKSRSASNKEA